MKEKQLCKNWNSVENIISFESMASEAKSNLKERIQMGDGSVDTRETIQSNPIWSNLNFEQRLHLWFQNYYRWYLLFRRWLNEASTDGIYMVGGYTRGGVRPPFPPHICRSTALHNVIRPSIHRGLLRFWYICPLLSRHSFAWKPPSSQPARGVTSVC